MRLFLCLFACAALFAALSSVGLAGGDGTVIATVKTAGKKSKPVRNASVFLGVTPVGGDFEARFGCTNRKGRAVFRNVPTDATLISATGPSGGSACKNKSFLLGNRPLVTQFYRMHDGLSNFDQFSLGGKASTTIKYRPRFYPAADLCDGCKFARQFNAKLRKALNLFYKQGKKGKSIKAIKSLRTPLVRNKNGQFNQDTAEEIAGYLKAEIDNIKAS